MDSALRHGFMAEVSATTHRVAHLPLRIGDGAGEIEFVQGILVLFRLRTVAGAEVARDDLRVGKCVLARAAGIR
jgi:hypothetical protein